MSSSTSNDLASKREYVQFLIDEGNAACNRAIEAIDRFRSQPRWAIITRWRLAIEAEGHAENGRLLSERAAAEVTRLEALTQYGDRTTLRS